MSYLNSLKSKIDAGCQSSLEIAHALKGVKPTSRMVVEKHFNMVTASYSFGMNDEAFEAISNVLWRQDREIESLKKEHAEIEEMNEQLLNDAESWNVVKGMFRK